MGFDDWPMPTRLKQWLRWCLPADMPTAMRVRNLIVASVFVAPAAFAIVFGVIVMVHPEFTIHSDRGLIAVPLFIIGFILFFIGCAVNRSRW